MCLFSVGFISQWWMRTRYPRWFGKYNYILAAALDGGTQVRFHTYSSMLASLLSQVILGRSWFSSFRLRFKERLGSLTCSRNGDDLLLHSTFVIHIDIELYIYRWGANQAG
jgi:OPT oligopeptide transporter protein